jgi:hypothetical protein
MHLERALIAIPEAWIGLSDDDQLLAFVPGASSFDELFRMLGIARLTRDRVDDKYRFGQGVSSTWLENPRNGGLPVLLFFTTYDLGDRRSAGGYRGEFDILSRGRTIFYFQEYPGLCRSVFFGKVETPLQDSDKFVFWDARGTTYMHVDDEAKAHKPVDRAH